MLNFNIACSVYLSPPYTLWKLVSLTSASLAGANKYYIGALPLIMKPLVKCTLLSLTQVVASGMTWQQHPHWVTDCTSNFSNQCDIYYSMRRWKWFTETSQLLQLVRYMTVYTNTRALLVLANVLLPSMSRSSTHTSKHTMYIILSLCAVFLENWSNKITASISDDLFCSWYMLILTSKIPENAVKLPFMI